MKTNVDNQCNSKYTTNCIPYVVVCNYIITLYVSLFKYYNHNDIYLQKIYK